MPSHTRIRREFDAGHVVDATDQLLLATYRRFGQVSHGLRPPLGMKTREVEPLGGGPRKRSVRVGATGKRSRLLRLVIGPSIAGARQRRPYAVAPASGTDFWNMVLASVSESAITRTVRHLLEQLKTDGLHIADRLFHRLLLCFHRLRRLFRCPPEHARNLKPST